MKNYTQVYVKNSFEAAKMYCKAFGAEITRELINENNTASIPLQVPIRDFIQNNVQTCHQLYQSHTPLSTGVWHHFFELRKSSYIIFCK